MKSTIHEHQKNNQKNVSKISIIFLGLIALSFTTAKAANNFKSQDLDQQEFTTLNVKITKQHNSINNSESNTSDTTIFNPASVIKNGYVKTNEDVIKENKLITESQEEVVRHLALEKTPEDQIAEDNQIIQSTVSKEVFPLDFEKINSKMQCVKVKNSNAFITAGIKL